MRNKADDDWWSLYNDGDGDDGTQAQNCYVTLGFRFQDL
jgi:hypothetical protein